MQGKPPETAGRKTRGYGVGPRPYARSVTGSFAEGADPDGLVEKVNESVDGALAQAKEAEEAAAGIVDAAEQAVKDAQNRDLTQEERQAAADQIEAQVEALEETVKASNQAVEKAEKDYADAADQVDSLLKQLDAARAELALKEDELAQAVAAQTKAQDVLDKANEILDGLVVWSPDPNGSGSGGSTGSDDSYYRGGNDGGTSGNTSGNTSANSITGIPAVNASEAGVPLANGPAVNASETDAAGEDEILMDIADGDVPLAGISNEEVSMNNHFVFWWWLLLLIPVAYMIVRRIQKNKERED